MWMSTTKNTTTSYDQNIELFILYRPKRIQYKNQTYSVFYKLLMVYVTYVNPSHVTLSLIIIVCPHIFW